MVIINQTIINNLAAKINAKEKQSNKTTTISSSSTDTQYPSAKAVYTALQNADSGATVDIDYYFDTTGKELVFEYDNISGISEGNSLSVSIATSWGSPTSDEKVPSEALVKSALDSKAASDHTHSQYLTEHQSLTNYIQKSQTSGLVKNDGTIDTNSYSQTGHTHNQYLTEHQSLANYIQKSQTAGLIKNDGTIDSTSYSTFSGSYSDLSNKPSYTATVTSSTANAYKIGSINISGSSVDIYAKDTDTQPPSASTTTPSADTTSGSYGSGTTYARANHTHPKSSLYAESSHTHSAYVNPTIADNLTTNDSSQVLSAKQGKVLKDYIDTLVGNIEEDMLS